MKEIDDTPLPETESEWDLDAMFDSIAIQIRQLTLIIANLETQRTANESNQDDPEWY